MAVLGFTGGLLHVLNHAVFKSLLVPRRRRGAARAPARARLDRLGGLLKRMPHYRRDASCRRGGHLRAAAA